MARSSLRWLTTLTVVSLAGCGSGSSAPASPEPDGAVVIDQIRSTSCPAPERGLEPTPDAATLAAKLSGPWRLCGDTSPFGTKDDIFLGFDGDPNRRWASSASLDDPAPHWTGTWESMPATNGFDLALHIEGGATLTAHPSFVESMPALRRLHLRSGAADALYVNVGFD
jgi:hypothetical protein